MDESSSAKADQLVNQDEVMSSPQSGVGGSLSSEDSSDDSEDSGSETSQSDSDSNSNESDVSNKSSSKHDDTTNESQTNVQKLRDNNNDDFSERCLNDDHSDKSNEDDLDDSDDGDEDETSRSTPADKTKPLNSKDLQQILENFPDALRRSSRSRKEPERFQAEAYDDSDESNSPKSNRRQRRRRKDSDEWNDPDGDGNDEEEEIDSGENDSADSSEQESKHLNRRLRSKGRTKPFSSNRRTSSRSCRSTSKTNKTHSRSYSDSESDQEDDDIEEEDEEENEACQRRKSSRKKTSRRTTMNPVSYKEESDYTDSEDLIADTTNDGLESGLTAQAQDLGELEDEGEMIEKVLEHRLGRLGATGPKTASYQIEEHGDPNADLKDEEVKEIQFLVKWKGWSYIHCTWESRQSLEEQKARGVKKIELYLKRDEDIKLWKKTASPEDIDYYEGQEELNCQLRQLHLNVERIIAHQPPKIGLSETCYPEYLCKWEGLPYSECTWEDGALINKRFNNKVGEYYQREKSQNIPAKYCRVLKQRPKFLPMKNQPSFIGGKDQLKLRDYQLDGLNWLAQSWCRDNSVILADEMGLGKTIQTISFLNYLYHQHALFGPFLLVVPLSTLAAWQKEFDIWAPSMNVVVYIGDATSRHMIREYEWSHSGNQRIKFNVLLTTYEILLREKPFLSLVPWAVLGVDEAHRLKNDESFLYKCLCLFDTNYRLLITGTPLQNSLRELWALLHFIMPSRFESWESFESEHKDAYQKGFSKLHSQLQQFLLRRVKKDVEKSLPAKVEQILRVDMTSIQKQFYKWILTKNYKALSKGIKGSVASFTNIVMELKKCCNHASLVRPFDDYSYLDPLQRLIRGSGKLLLLDKLLCRLKETGHRVLIFSQMVRMLDLLGEYLSLRRFPYQRLDGSIRGEFRKQALEHFNAEGSQDFCFLLSTRAGGLGINLATADTVIIFDSDWNPQNDLQAQARAHRIGQKNQVNIYRLVTKGSVEEDIIERAKRKMVLDHLVIQRMDTSGHTIMRSSTTLQENKNTNNTTPFNKEELSAILKFGAEDLFKETENGDEEPQCDIDEILKRAETREDDGPQTLGDELLNSFKVASFNFNEEEDVQAFSVGSDELANQKEWDEIIPESERVKFEQDERHKEEMEIMMLPRSRNKSKMSGNRSDSGDEYDPNAKNDSPASDDSDSERPRRRGRPKSSYKELIKGFSEQEVRRFIKSYRKFPMPLNRLESIAIDAELQEKPLPDLRRLAVELEQNCQIAMKESEKDQSNEMGPGRKNNRGPSFKLGGVTVFAKGILTNQKDLEPLALMLPNNSDERKKWLLTGIKVKSANWDCSWSVENDSRLLAGVYEYGLGSWEAIKMDPSYKLTDKILPDGELKPQAKQLQSRVEYLLKVMHRHLASQKKLKEEPPTLKAKIKKAKNEKELSNNRTKNEKFSNQLGESSLPTKKDKKKKLDLCVDKTRTDKEKHKKKHKDKKKDKKREKKTSLSDSCSNSSNCHSTIGSVDELTSQVFNECKEKMRAVKKALKALNKIEEQQQKLSKSERKDIFYEHIATIGAHIDSCLREHQHDSAKMKEWRNNLWTFVSKFTEFPAKKLYKFYRRVKQLKPVSKPNDPDKSIRATSSGSNMLDDHANHSSGSMGASGHEANSSRMASGHYYRFSNNSNNQYVRKESRYGEGIISDPCGNITKRNYYGSTSGGPPAKFSKHSHHGYRDYDREYGSSSYHHGPGYYGSSSTSSWSSKHDGYRNNNNNSVYENNRYHSSNKNYYNHRSSDRSTDRSFDRRTSFNRACSNEYQQPTTRSHMPPPALPSGSYSGIGGPGPNTLLNNGAIHNSSNHINTSTTNLTPSSVTANNCWTASPSAALLPTPPATGSAPLINNNNNHHHHRLGSPVATATGSCSSPLPSTSLR